MVIVQLIGLWLLSLILLVVVVRAYPIYCRWHYLFLFPLGIVPGIALTFSTMQAFYLGAQTGQDTYEAVGFVVSTVMIIITELFVLWSVNLPMVDDAKLIISVAGVTLMIGFLIGLAYITFAFYLP